MVVLMMMLEMMVVMMVVMGMIAVMMEMIGINGSIAYHNMAWLREGRVKIYNVKTIKL